MSSHPLPLISVPVTDKLTAVLSLAHPTLTPFARLDSPWSLATLDATNLPPASRQREMVRLASNKLSNGYALFVHYVQPTLELRRQALLDSGTTSKKFSKKVGKLYEELDSSQKAFWNGESARLRFYIKGKVISHEECVRNVGTPDMWNTYIHYAESAVAQYLRTPLPIASSQLDATDAEYDKTIATTTSLATAIDAPLRSLEQPLLNTIPDSFTVEPRMLYGHFAKYNLDEILTTPTRKRQLEKLHQLADLFDQTGKVLFYYYAYPRLWKRMRPLDVDESIATFTNTLALW